MIIQITMTALPRYEIEVMIIDYDHTNPGSERISCNPHQCVHECCDGFTDYNTFQCRRCIYSLRNVETVTDGCPDNGTVMTSDITTNDVSIDFPENTVLGPDNPLAFPGLSGTWNVSTLLQSGLILAIYTHLLTFKLIGSPTICCNLGSVSSSGFD